MEVILSIIMGMEAILSTTTMDSITAVVNLQKVYNPGAMS
ncbi:hypothetical protein J2Y67_005561 [Neobacillus niacini]|nr:hypothetical protein [Neobacillus niacini]